MSRHCDYCGKGPQTGHNIRNHHSVQWKLRAPKTKRRWLPNLQPARVLKEGVVQRVRVCAKCLKAGKVLRAA
jgi:large subunit ribosomal protein L28